MPEADEKPAWAAPHDVVVLLEQRGAEHKVLGSVKERFLDPLAGVPNKWGRHAGITMAPWSSS